MALQLRRGTNRERLGLTLVEGEMVYVQDHALSTLSATNISSALNTIIFPLNHGFVLNQQIKYLGQAAQGLVTNQVYFVKTIPSTTSATLSTTLNGPTVDITGTSPISFELEFALGPTDALGAPLGRSVSPLWAGDGTTIGGVPAGSTILDELLDVTIGIYGNVGQYGEVLANNDVLQYNSETNQWENRTNLTIDGTAQIAGTVNTDTGLTTPTISTQAGEDLNISAATTRDITIAVTDSADPVTLVRTTSNTTIPNRTLTLRAASTGTPIVGYGNTLEFETETTANTFRRSGYIGTLSTAATDGVLDRFKMIFGVMDAGIDRTGMELDSLGNLQIDGTLEIDGNQIKNSASNTVITMNNLNTELAGDLSVGGGDITAPAGITTGNLFNNDGIATVNIGNGATTEVNLGRPGSGRVLVKSNTLDLQAGQLTFLAGTTGTPAQNAQIKVERGTGTDASLTWNEGIDTWQLTNDLNVQGNLAVNGGDITSTDSTANIFNSGVVDINIGNGATQFVRIGSAAGGTTILQSPTLQVDGNATIAGNLTVNGDLTYLNVADLQVEDKNIILARGNTTDLGANLGGITLKGATDKTILWNNTLSQWDISGGVFSPAIIAGSNIGTNGDTFVFNNEDGTAGNFATLLVRRGVGPDVAFRWNNNGRWESTVDGSAYIVLPNQNLDTISNPSFAGVTGGNVRVGSATDNEIDTSTGNLVIDSAGGTVTVDDNLIVSGAATVNGNGLTVANNGYIYSSGGLALTLTGNNVAVAGNLSVGTVQVATNVISTSSGDLIIEPAGPGDVYLKTDNIVVGDLNTAVSVTTQGTGNLTLNTGGGVNSGTVQIVAGANGAINLTPDGTGSVVITKADINSGTIDNTVIGAGTAAAATFTTVTATNTVYVPDLVIDSIATLNTASVVTTSTAVTTISSSPRQSQKVVISITDTVTGEVHILEALAIRKGTAAYLTTYAEMTSNTALAAFTADVDGSNLRIRATPASANSTTFTVVRTSIN